MIFKKKSQKVTSSVEFPVSIEVGNQSYIIDVVFAPKKSSSVSIKENRLEFRLSSYLSSKKAQEHFSDLLKKIHKKIEKRPTIRGNQTIFDVLDKMCFIFANERYYIEYKNKLRGVKLEENTFYVSHKIKPDVLEKYIVKLLILKYTDRMKKYVLALNAQTYNYKIKDVEVKLVKSKWGHCTHDNKIMINLKLLNASIEILDYVIVHEIAHVSHKNHSNAFWHEVARFCPYHKQLRKMLKNSPPVLFAREENIK